MIRPDGMILSASLPGIFEQLRIGIRSSSSHTYGPMVAARDFIHPLQKAGLIGKGQRIKNRLYDSLTATGKGHYCPLMKSLRRNPVMDGP